MCVTRYKTSRDASKLNQSLSVVEKFLPQCQFAESLSTLLHYWHFYDKHAARELLQEHADVQDQTKGKISPEVLLQENTNLANLLNYT